MSKEKIQDAVHQKEFILEDMERKIETLKRLVEENQLEEIEPVSYTHLTLPTKA